MAVPTRLGIFSCFIVHKQTAAKVVLPSRYAVFFSIVIFGCLLDLATKSWIFNWLGMPGTRATWWVWKDVFGLQTSLNEGALFGIGQGMVVLFTALSIVAALGILFWLFVAGAARDPLLTVALGLVTAGILGNLYDRLGLPGLTWHVADRFHEVGAPVHAVRDWILVMIGRYSWPTFNVADSLLVCGAILLVWHAFWHDARKQPALGSRPHEPGF